MWRVYRSSKIKRSVSFVLKAKRQTCVTRTLTPVRFESLFWLLRLGLDPSDSTLRTRDSDSMFVTQTRRQNAQYFKNINKIKNILATSLVGQRSSNKGFEWTMEEGKQEKLRTMSTTQRYILLGIVLYLVLWILVIADRFQGDRNMMFPHLVSTWNKTLLNPYLITSGGWIPQSARVYCLILVCCLTLIAHVS